MHAACRHRINDPMGINICVGKRGSAIGVLDLMSLAKECRASARVCQVKTAPKTTATANAKILRTR